MRKGAARMPQPSRSVAAGSPSWFAQRDSYSGALAATPFRSAGSATLFRRQGKLPAMSDATQAASVGKRNEAAARCAGVPAARSCSAASRAAA